MTRMQRASWRLQFLRSAPVVPSIKAVQAGDKAWVAAFRNPAEPATYSYLHSSSGRFQVFRTQRQALAAAQRELELSNSLARPWCPARGRNKRLDDYCS